MVDLLSSRSRAQSESQLAIRMGGVSLFIVNFRCFVVHRYLINFNTDSQSASLGDSFFLPCMLTAAAMSGLVNVAMHKRAPLPACTVYCRSMVYCVGLF